VISPQSKITLRLLPTYHSVNLTLDGQEVFPVEEQDVVMINHKKAKRVSLVKNSTRSFFETLKEKFVHGRRS
jgi:NAD+ kinase